MRLRSDNDYSKLSRDDTIKHLRRINEFDFTDTDKNTDILKNKLKKFERTRNLIFWHDGQLATDQQLLYSDERLGDILKIKKPIQIPDGIQIYDTVRAFKGDHPASQFEAGQQKGGNYACHGCCINSHCIKSIPHSFKCPTINLSDRISKIHATASSKERLKNNTIVKLYHHLDLPALIDEHQQQNIKTSSLTKQSLQASLDFEMHGIQQMPALLLTAPFSQLDNIYLDQCEILVNEPLHDISNHIKNLQHEIPHHVPKDKKALVKDIITSSFNGKEAKNSADHRKSLLLITNWFLSNMKNHFLTNILITLCEIQEILYLPDKKRSVQKIMRLIFSTFKHAMLLKIHLDGKLKSETEQKFFGIYYHSLIRHSPEQHRLFSGRSSNTEKEEAQFNALKTFTNLTSNYHPENVIFNSIIRLQPKQVLNEGECDYHEEDLTFLKLYQPIKATSDSLIPFEWIEKHATCYQVLLQQISDYLLCDIKCWQETDDGVVFFDINQPKLDLKLHHSIHHQLLVSVNIYKIAGNFV